MILILRDIILTTPNSFYMFVKSFFATVGDQPVLQTIRSVTSNSSPENKYLRLGCSLQSYSSLPRTYIEGFRPVGKKCCISEN